MKETIHYIYRIVNKINGKCYIGYSINPERRFRAHKTIAANNKGYVLHNAIRKYGIDSFYMEVISCSKDYEYTITELESYFIKLFNSRTDGYNLTDGGESNYGWSPSLETRQKISAIHKGKKLSQHHKNKISEHMKLHPLMHNSETRQKVSDTHKARGIRPIMTVEQKELKRLRQIGKPIHSDEWKQQLRDKFKKSPPMHNPVFKAKAIANKKGKGSGIRNGRALFVKIFNPSNELVCEGHLKSLCIEYGFPFNKFIVNSRVDTAIQRNGWIGWNVIPVPR